MIGDLGEALTVVFYTIATVTAIAFFLAIYTLWQAFFGFTPWEVCVKMGTDTAIVQCMKAHYD